MRIVLVQLWSLVVVDDTNQECQSINDEERELQGKDVSRASNTQHDSDW